MGRPWIHVLERSFRQEVSLEERYHINHSMLKLEFLSRLDRLLFEDLSCLREVRE